jgi:hypothetical protein
MGVPVADDPVIIAWIAVLNLVPLDASELKSCALYVVRIEFEQFTGRQTRVAGLLNLGSAVTPGLRHLDSYGIRRDKEGCLSFVNLDSIQDPVRSC